MLRFLALSILPGVIFLLLDPAADRTPIYVDQTLPFAITDGSYSTANRDSSGSEGNAFPTIKEAILAMEVGDTIILRGGTYQEGHIRIPTRLNGSAWSEGNFNTLMSFPGEWAVLDGQNGGGTGGIDGQTVGEDKNSECVIGMTVSDKSGAFDLKYWKFERLEIMNGASADGKYAAGFSGNGGPFIFRNCYIHDNLTTTDIGFNNPGGLRGEVWHDCIVEYCYFARNGALNSNNHNLAHINIYSDYKPNQIAENGFVDKNNHLARNEFRYNLFENSAVGIKYKQDQFFTGRNPAGGHPYSDEYKYYGDKIHHNIFIQTLAFGTNGRQDFIQIYNNIFFGNELFAIGIGESDTRSIYKAITFNNTIISPTHKGIGRVHHGWYSFMPGEYFGYDYNNILVNVLDGWNWCDISVDERPTFFDDPDYSNYIGHTNYFYDPGTGYNDPNGTQIYWIADQRYTKSEFTALYPGAVNYWSEDDPGNSLFKGSTGADRFKTLPGHMVEGTTPIGSAGAGCPHPYLAGVHLPSYLGATNPNGTDSGLGWDPIAQNPDDSGWVDYVLYVVGDLPAHFSE